LLSFANVVRLLFGQGSRISIGYARHSVLLVGWVRVDLFLLREYRFLELEIEFTVLLENYLDDILRN